ncbi:RagB/SusD family nutrient uptake outer membrane protein [Hymenobacter sp. HSC-4F20]|uniref:RagB/SusD family nutrient uptake outer membrane protein n=1 Tax=Hymenobacter sp. HSC-4F20 TaxID=2864135 RepID=UPI001C73BA6C|nr:RagB/SusD family nutrient uptake outer membrane protein [Hymenobacter sp. HSC-4F20]MBX0289263.1 RagB/SusD family nutrient uptake outer membrane protein [Hymenobacter sp. HSC-4F20]
MKKILIPVFALTLLSTACDVLDKDPLPSITPENFFTSADDAEASLTAAYDALQGAGLYGQDIIVVGEMPSDNCTSANGDVAALENITWNSTTGQVRSIYRDSYIGINRANSILKYVPAIDMPAARKNQILGEARFLRALHFFNLVKLYGGVPLRLEPTETGTSEVLNLPRATADAVYAQVIQDLTTAEPLVATSNLTRVTQNAVNALLARVYLTQRQWAPAQAAAGKVLSSGSLAPSFKSLFPADNKSESIFEVQFAGSADGGNILPDLLLPSPPATYSFPKFSIPTLYRSQASAQPTDLTFVVDTLTDKRWSFQGVTNAGRDHASYVDGGRGTGNDDGPFVYKWSGNPNGFNSPDNTYVLRYADVVLMYAEAANELSGPTADALAKLNLIRQRAGLTELTSTSPQAASKQALRTEIDRQRRLELAFEGERWFDLLRYARHEQADPAADHAVTALDVIRAQRKTPTADPNYLLFPIPLDELNTNPNVQQNPGY